MTDYSSNLTPEQRLDAMVRDYTRNQASGYDYMSKTGIAIALDLLKRLDAAEAPCVCGAKTRTASGARHVASFPGSTPSLSIRSAPAAAIRSRSNRRRKAMTEAPRCDKPGCGLFKMPLQGSGGDPIYGLICPRNADAHALCARVAELEKLLESFKKSCVGYGFWQLNHLIEDADRLLSKEESHAENL